MDAVHAPTGVEYEANSVPEEIKRDPWVCVCGLQYKGHRRAVIGKSPDDEGKVLRRATFVRREGTEHAPTCDYSIPGAQKKIAGSHPDVVRVEKDVLFLDIDRSSPAVQGTASEAPDFSGATTRYGAVLAAARSIAKIIDRLGEDDEALSKFKVRHCGSTYPWDVFSFGPTETGLEGMDDASRDRDAADRRERPERPWFVRAVVDSITTARGGKAAQLRLRSSDASGPRRVYVFAPIESAAGQSILKLVSGSTVAVLADKDGRLSLADAPWLEVEEARQLYVYPEAAAKRPSGEGKDGTNG